MTKTKPQRNDLAVSKHATECFNKFYLISLENSILTSFQAKSKCIKGNVVVVTCLRRFLETTHASCKLDHGSTIGNY